MHNIEQNSGGSDAGASNIPAISVVIPTYNRLRTLPRSLESVLRQTFEDIEVIVVDDCSNDGSWEYLQSVRDPRLRAIRHEKNGGAGAARNTGVKAARAELVAFQDSDDEWLVTKLETQLAEYRRVNSPEYGAIYCAKITNGEGKLGVYGPREVQYMPLPGYEKTSGDLSRELIRHAMISTQTLMARKDLLESIGGFDETVKLGEDWDLTTRLSRATKILFVDKPLVLCFTSPDSISKVKANQALARKLLFDRNFDLISQDRALHAFYLTEFGRIHQRAGCWRQSLPWLLKAISVYPFDRRAWPALALGAFKSLFSNKRLDLM